jgi:hypothetical protein
VRARVARELIAAGAVSPIDGLKQAVWPGPELEALYRDEWNPAVKAAGLEHRTPYAMRHTFASFAIAAGIPSFEIARMMGTSVEMLDKTYGHLLRDAGLAWQGGARGLRRCLRGRKRIVWTRSGRRRMSPLALKPLGYAVGVPGFEPGTSCPPDKRANQAAPHPVRVVDGIATRV